MIVLHAAVANGRLHLWGETPASVALSPTRRRGRRPRRPEAQPLPYGASAEQLAVSVIEAVPNFVLTARAFQQATLWLPTVAGRPVPSSPLIAEPPDGNGRAELAPWTVTVQALSTARALDVLCACVGKETLAPGIIVGKSLAYWLTAFRFAGALVVRQQFLADLETEDDGYHARWEPVFSGAEADRLAGLARAMPAACRALTTTGDGPPDEPAPAVLASFLGPSVDYLVRSSLAAARPVSLPRPRAQPPAFDSVHDEWLYALATADGKMSAAAAELAPLARQVQDWRRPVTVSTDAPFRLCFRLEEPRLQDDNGQLAVANGRAWYVRYLLQDTHDPSLLIPVAAAWDPRGRHARVLHRRGFHPREYLLSALGQASQISPRIEESLKSSTPGGHALDTQGAHEFLTEKAWLLEQAGFGVLLPAWWTRKGTRLHLSARAYVPSPPSMSSAGGLSLEQIVHFDWQVALGDQTLSLQELQTLARIKQPLVRVRGQWVQVSAAEIQTALDFWKKKGEGTATLREVVQMALGAGKAPGGLAFEGVRATGWVGDLLTRLQGGQEFEELPVPHGFHGTLRPYQVRGYSWLGFLSRWGFGACLADDMGLGKTVQTLTLLQQAWETSERRPTLLICPMSVVGNWQKEAERFTPELPVLVHHGVERKRDAAAFKNEAAEHALVLSSYGLLHRDLDILKDVPWTCVVLDEAQNIKNPQTKQAQAARALPAGHKIALTGTPVENHVGDLWSIMEFLNPGLLGTQADFKRTFFYPIQANGDEEAARRLRRLTGPFLLRRLKTDKDVIADLPDKLEMKVFCTLTKEQASLYEAVVLDATKKLEESEGIQRKGVVLATLTKLKQVCNHPAHFLGDNSPIPDRSGKLARLTEMLEEVLDTGDRALIFTQFTEMGEIIQKHLQETFGREVLFLHGAVQKKQRDRMVARFQEADGDAEAPRLFVLSLKAGGTGLNLTAANHVFHFDRWWNPAVENQATDRAFRIGQMRNVQVHKFLCAGTLEEKIDAMIERKQEIAGQIVGSGEAWLTELSTGELKDLFALRQGAYGE